MNRETCFFYSKTNGCRHGLECVKIHPSASRGRIVVIKNMYLYPKNDPASTLDNASVQIHVDLFYEDWFTELSLTYGFIRRIVIASNSCVQLLGNIYVEFESEMDAGRCVEKIGKRCYSGKKILAELGNCYRIDDCICTDHEKGICGKGEQCSFVHVARISGSLMNELFTSQELFHAGISDRCKPRTENDLEQARRENAEGDFRNGRFYREHPGASRNFYDPHTDAKDRYYGSKDQHGFNSRSRNEHREGSYQGRKRELNTSTHEDGNKRTRYEGERNPGNHRHYSREYDNNRRYYRR